VPCSSEPESTQRFIQGGVSADLRRVDHEIMLALPTAPRTQRLMRAAVRFAKTSRQLRNAVRFRATGAILAFFARLGFHGLPKR
jgi:hypothetical protein